ELRQMAGHTREVCSVAFAPMGKALSAGYDREMLLWDLDTGKKVRVFTGHTDNGYGVAYSDQAKLAATCGFDLTIRLWDLETGKEVRKLTGHTQVMTSVRFSPDGKRLLSASYDSTVRIWAVESGKELKQIQAHRPHAYCAAFS